MRAVFSGYIHVYDKQQAKKDGATQAINDDSRLAKRRLKDEAFLMQNAQRADTAKAAAACRSRP